MCPECFYVADTAMLQTTIVPNYIHMLEHKYFGECPKCGKEVNFIELNANMGQIIKILNTKGYYTAFSCEGHFDTIYNSKEFSNPYIYFYLWEDSKVLYINPLPDTWYISQDSKTCHIFTISDNIIDIMPKNIETEEEFFQWIASNWDQEKRLKDIYDWAIGLPEKDNGLKALHRIYITKKGNKIIDNNCEKTISELNKDAEE